MDSAETRSQTNITIIPYSDLVKVKLIDKPHMNGKHGDSYEGTFKGCPVAIKKLEISCLREHVKRDFEVYSHQHPNLLYFYGICDQPGNICVVTDLMPYSLRKFYLEYTLYWNNIFDFAEQIAIGLSYLHSKGIGHKCLKSNNVFVTNDLNIKISDYGCSNLRIEVAANAGDHLLRYSTVRWRAPETFTREYAKNREDINCIKPADVYSYGLLLWEMRKGTVPYSAYSESEILKSLVGTTEVIDPDWPTNFKTLLENCWNIIPTSRPSIDDILVNLRKTTFVDFKTPLQENVKHALEIEELKAVIDGLKSFQEILQETCLVYKTEIQRLKFDNDKLKQDNDKF